MNILEFKQIKSYILIFIISLLIFISVLHFEIFNTLLDSSDAYNDINNEVKNLKPNENIIIETENDIKDITHLKENLQNNNNNYYFVIFSIIAIFTIFYVFYGNGTDPGIAPSDISTGMPLWKIDLMEAITVENSIKSSQITFTKEELLGIDKAIRVFTLENNLHNGVNSTNLIK